MEVLFRAKHVKDESILSGEWVFGDLIHYADSTKAIRQQETGSEFNILQETIGQYIGINDINDNRIFAGDILDDGAVVEWFNKLVWDSCGSLHSGYYSKKWFIDKENNELDWNKGFEDVKVIGNIYDNLDLLDKN